MAFKKLMILGGFRYAVPVVEAAHRLGVHVITVDYLPDNAAHKVFGEYCSDRDEDKDSVPETIPRLSGGGIVSFAHDAFNLPVTCGV